jgi:hypothetical protein
MRYNSDASHHGGVVRLKQRHSFLFLAALLLLICCQSEYAADPPKVVITKQVDPDWGTLTSGYLLEQREIKLGVDAGGEPYSIQAKTAIPDNVVRALMQWRFKTGNFVASLKFAVRVPLTPGLERAQTPRWTFTAPLTAAKKQASELDAAGAAQLLANLPNAEEPDNPRAVLLFYFAGKGASDPGAAQARRDLILWLVRVYPQDPILSSSYATVSASDAEATSSIKQAWLNAVKEYPQDDLVIQGAANFLRLSDPMAAIKLVASHHWEGQANWLGAVAATGALGVNGVSPENGAAISSSPASVNASLREAILKSPDLKVVLSAMATTSQMAHDLSAHNALPADFGPFCESALKHTRDLYSQTSLDCDATPAKPSGSLQRIGGNVMEANIIKKVQPTYPQAAKNRRIQGTVEFLALIDRQGVIERLDLVKAPLALYDESYKTVMQWRYRPTRLNGEPIEVITDLIVNYTLSQ